MTEKAVLTGEYFESGNIACAEGAIVANCRFFAGYPITPATEIIEHMSRRLPEVNGRYLQMEDELGSIASVIGASYAGVKAMTATSGPGISLMNENIGLAVMTETPCVIVNVMRGSPSTGQPTKGGQGDVMQAKWGSHGDYEIIALSPNCVQEMFDLTIKAFNLSEQYRIPVFLLAEANVGHLYEKLIIPNPEAISIVNRKRPEISQENYSPFKADQVNLVPPMVPFGEGYHFYATGLTHNEHGFPDMTEITQQRLVTRLCDKIRKNVDEIVMVEKMLLDDADVGIVTYGLPSRSAKKTVEMARKENVKTGLLRLITLWPFPEKQIKELCETVKVIVVAEMNYGQIVREIERVACNTPVFFLPKLGGEPHTPEEILVGVRRSIK